MEILFDNPLANLYGPYFLIFYGFVIFFSAVGLALAKTQFDRTDRISAPPLPAAPDPYELAYLRGGENELARAVAFGLYKKGVFKFDGEGPAATIEPLPSDARPSLTGIERTAAEWFGTTRRPSDLFGAFGLRSVLSGHAAEYRRKLESSQLLLDSGGRKSWRVATASVLLMIAGIGGYKLAAALYHGHRNVAFLIVFLIVGVIAATAASRLPRVTKLGRAYLDRLTTAFGGAGFEPAAAAAAPNGERGGVDPLLLSVALLGTTALAGTRLDDYRRVFPQGAGVSAGGSSCSSGCGSSSDGGGGGSSCGGSSCGGGCGGCGGGGD